MNPDDGLLEGLRTRLDVRFKFCEDSVNRATYQSAIVRTFTLTAMSIPLSPLSLYARVRICQLSPSWSDHEPGLLIKNHSPNHWQRAPAGSVVQNPSFFVEDWDLPSWLLHYLLLLGSILCLVA